MMKDKELMIFPIISGAMSILLFAAIMAPGFYASGITSNEPNSGWVVAICFIIYYFLGTFVVVFFNTGLIACAQIRLSGGDPRFRDGIAYALKHVGRIALWALITATVGYILRAIRERGGLIGSIVAGIVGIAWNLITFFVIPVIIFENLGVIESIKRSASLFRKTWGENMVLRFSLALMFGLLGLVGLIPIGVAVATKSAVVIAIVVGVVFLFWVILAIIGYSLNGIFATALYDYASTGIVPTAYSPEVIQNAFTPRRGFLGGYR